MIRNLISGELLTDIGSPVTAGDKIVNISVKATI